MFSLRSPVAESSKNRDEFTWLICDSLSTDSSRYRRRPLSPLS